MNHREQAERGADEKRIQRYKVNCKDYINGLYDNCIPKMLCCYQPEGYQSVGYPFE